MVSGFPVRDLLYVLLGPKSFKLHLWISLRNCLTDCGFILYINVPSFLYYQETVGASAQVAPDRVRDLQSEVEGVKNIMSQNVERILARGENLDHLRNKTEDLEASVSILLPICK